MNISKEEIEAVKQANDIVSVIKSRGIELKKKGKNYTALCPFHEEKTPSFTVDPVKQLYHCFGCSHTGKGSAGGDVIGFVVKHDRISFPQAFERLAAKGAVVRGQGAGKTKKDSKAAVSIPQILPPDTCTLHPSLQKLLNQSIDYYHETLKKSEQALAYLEKRGIGNTDAITTFKLGYADRTLTSHLLKKENPTLRESLKECGILRKTGHEHFHGCLVIPVLDEQGNVQEVYGRKIIHSSKPNTINHLYLPGRHKGVWNVQALQEYKDIILCESLIDALTFWCAGFKNVTSSYGTEGSVEHIQAFKQYKTEGVVIAYDRDPAGERAALSLTEKLHAMGITTSRILFPKDMDANEYASIAKPASKNLEELIRASLIRGKEKRRGQLAVGRSQEKAEAQSPESDLPTATVKGEDIEIVIGERIYRVRALSKNLASDAMRINVRLSVKDAYHVDTLDLYNARHRTTFINAAAKEVYMEADVIKRDIGKILLKLEELQTDIIKKALKPEKVEVVISPEEKKEALEYLKHPQLLDRIVEDFEKCGLVGEKINTLFGYLASISRKLDDPLAVIVQSSSGAGKSTLMDAVYDFIPPEDKIRYTAMTGQSLFYMDKDALVHKTLVISEDEGAERARYAIKTMQSEKNLTIACTGKDPKTGRQNTETYEVNGPVQMFTNSTQMEMDEELQNRFNIMTSNETREQTQAIHAMQRKMETLEGLHIKQEREHIVHLHQNIQRFIRPLDVVNPYADRLTFIDTRLRTRRDHKKYLTLIRSIALVHQHQRPIKKREYRGKVSEYIEVTPKDIETANILAHDILGRSLDELAPQTRRLLTLITEMVQEQCKKKKIEQADYRFTRKEIRDYTGWGNTQLKIHLHRLEDLEYLLVHKGSRGQTFVYELLYKGEGKHGTPFVLGLIDVNQLNRPQKAKRIPNKSGVKPNKSGSSRPQIAPKSAPSRVKKIRGKSDGNSGSGKNT